MIQSRNTNIRRFLQNNLLENKFKDISLDSGTDKNIVFLNINQQIFHLQAVVDFNKNIKLSKENTRKNKSKNIYQVIDKKPKYPTKLKPFLIKMNHYFALVRGFITRHYSMSDNINFTGKVINFINDFRFRTGNYVIIA